MNLVFTLTAYPPSIGGAQIHTHRLARALQAAGHAVQVVSQWDEQRTDWLLGTTLRAPEVARDYVQDGIAVHRLGLSRGDKARLLLPVLGYYPWMARALPGVSAVLEEQIKPFTEQADLIHNVRIGREGLSYASLNLARKQNVPFVFTPNHHPRWVGWRYRAYLELYRRADALIALTEAEKRLYVALGVEEGNVHVTGIGPVLADSADGDAFRQRFGIRGRMVLFVGQHYAYKGFTALLRAAPLVWQQAPDAEFVFIGPPVGQSEKLFTEWQAERRIHRLGSVDLQTKTDAMQACDVFCLPSMQESFGGVFTEAWSFARPVIGGDIPALREVIREGEDGLLTSQEPKMLAEKICLLLRDNALAARLGAAGKAKVEQHFSWEALADKTAAVYAQVV